jgi:hypothetical protein
MQAESAENHRVPLLWSFLVVGVCFLPSLIFEGTHPGEAAVAAIATVSSVGPSGSTTLPAELASIWSALVTLLRGVGQDSAQARRNAP